MDIMTSRLLLSLRWTKYQVQRTRNKETNLQGEA